MSLQVSVNSGNFLRVEQLSASEGLWYMELWNATCGFYTHCYDFVELD
jgi:hypothetical protein